MSQDNAPHLTGGGVGKGYGYSIYFMVGLPYLMIGGGIFYVARWTKKAHAKAMAEAEARRAAQPNSPLDNAPAS